MTALRIGLLACLAWGGVHGAPAGGAEVRLSAEHDHWTGIGDGYELLLDTGTFHGLGDEERMAMGRELTGLAAPGATLILDCFSPRRRGPLPRGGQMRGLIGQLFRERG